MIRWLVVVSALAVALVVALVGAEGSRATVEVQTGVVASVYDGDTLSLSDGRRVRLLQIDTPELGSGECYSRAARNALLKLVRIGSRVRLEADARLDNVDWYGRLLRYVHRGTLNANTTLVRGGAAARISTGATSASTPLVCSRTPKRRRPRSGDCGEHVPAPSSTRSTRLRPASAGRPRRSRLRTASAIRTTRTRAFRPIHPTSTAPTSGLSGSPPSGSSAPTSTGSMATTTGGGASKACRMRCGRTSPGGFTRPLSLLSLLPRCS
jgi:endonuclease YncB( thermonuclease family)